MSSLTPQIDQNVGESSCIKLLLKQVYDTHITKVKALEVHLQELTEKLVLLEASKRDKSECSRCEELQKVLSSIKQGSSATFEKQTGNLDDFKENLVATGSKESRLSKSTVLKEITEKENVIHNSRMEVLNHVKVGGTAQNTNFEEITVFGDSLDNVGSTVHSSNTRTNLQTAIDIKHDGASVTFPNKTTYNRKNFFPNSQNSVMELSMDESNIVLVAETCDNDRDVNIDYVSIINSCVMQPITSPKARRTCLDIKNNKILGKENNHSEEKENCKKSGLLKEIVNYSENYKCANVNTFGGKGSKKNERNNCLNSNSLAVSNVKNKSTLVENLPVHNIDRINSFVGKNSSSCETQSSVELEQLSDFPINSNFFEVDEDLMLSKSPSLLKNTEVNVKIHDLDTVHEFDDRDDFQNIVVNKRESELWKSCKKPPKMTLPLKPMKCTSKFKMTLESPGFNFRKPKYKQTKLSESIFASKSQDMVKETQVNKTHHKKTQIAESEAMLENKRLKLYNESEIRKNIFPSFQESSPAHNFTVDLDQTFIPENYQHCSLKNSVEVPHRADVMQSSNLQNISPKDRKNQDICKTKRHKKRDLSTKCEKKDAKVVNNRIGPVKEHDSFDRLPKEPLPKYKFKEESVRNQNKRRQLQGYECKECEKYFSDLGLSENEKHKRLKHCSRHRAIYVPPSTPEHFWELEFPDTQECKARGYLAETQKVALKSRRKRPL